MRGKLLMNLLSAPVLYKATSAFMVFTLLAAGLMGFTTSDAEAVQTRQGSYVPGRLIVKFLPNVTQAKKQQFLGQIHAKTLHKFSLTKAELIQVSPERSLGSWRK